MLMVPFKHSVDQVHCKKKRKKKKKMLLLKVSNLVNKNKRSTESFFAV